MKPFDLAKALAGEPVTLRDGAKAYVLHHLSDVEDGFRPLIGYCLTDENKQIPLMWLSDGALTGEESYFDIVGMWEEQPKLIKPNYRFVEYFGNEIVLSHDYQYLAINENGECYGYVTEPFYHNVAFNQWDNDFASGYIGKFDLNGFDWKETLQHFPLED